MPLWRRAATVVACMLAGAASASAAATCGPSPTGSPCATLGATALPGDDAVPPVAGNPVHLATGNKLLTEVDLPPLPGPLGLEIVRHYNSLHALPGVPPTALGRGWRLSYDVELAVIGPTVQVLLADGRRLMFRRDAADPSSCAGDDPAHGRLQAHRTATGERFDWLLPDGRRMAFDGRGRLVQVRTAAGDVLDLQRDAAGQLVRAIDPAGRSLVFGWTARGQGGFAGLAWIDSPVGRFGFQYGGPGAAAPPAILAAVSRPAADGARVERRYHHEDARFPALVTGISVQGPDGFGGTLQRRLTAYRYGDDGRAVETMLGAPDAAVRRLRVDRSRPGETHLTDALGRTTVVRHAIVGGRFVVTATRGPGCEACPPSPLDILHDAHGRVIAEVALDAAGRPLRSRRVTRDALGRPVEVRVIEHAADGGADRELAVERVGHDGDAWMPSRIERTGVVEGRPVTTEVLRDPEGRVRRVVETGFAPIDAAGRPLPTGLDGRVPAAFSSAATPLRRETRFEHATLAGRSRLVAIDGPLPNGPAGTPADSDVTRLHWDARGDRIVRIERPGGEIAELGHDASGRPIEVRSETGTTRWSLDPASGQVLAVEREPSGGGPAAVTRWRFDAAGDPVEQIAGWRTADGWRADADARQWRAGWDPAGRPRWRVDAFGGVVQWTHDAAGRRVEERRVAGRMAAVRRFAHDDHDHLVAVADGRGGLWPVAGVPDGEPPLRGAPRLRWIHDDFGRVVARLSADHGDRVDRHDAAGRLIERHEPDGVVVRWQHDLRGRVLARTVTAVDGTVRTTRWSWDGPRLVSVHDPVQREHFRHDAAGRVVERRVEVAAGDGGVAVAAVQRWRHDAVGRIAGWTLADGTWLRLTRNAQGQVVALHRERLATPWLRWLQPDQTIVSGLERDGVGLSHAVHGNGLVSRRLRTADGALVRRWLAPAEPSRRATAGRADRLAPIAGLGAAQAAAAEVGRAVAAWPAGDGPAAAAVAAPGWIGRATEPGARLDDRYLWDEAGNLLRRESRGEGPAIDQDYLHDGRDQLLQVVTRRAGDGLPVGLERFAYDAASGRVLAQAVPAAGSEAARDTDPARAAASASAASGVVRATVDAASHRLLGVARHGVPAPEAWRHDAAGRVVVAGARRYGWDAQGRLASVRDGDRLLVRQAFNHRGERVRRSGAAGTEVHLHDDRRRWADVDARGRIKRQWVWLADLPVAVIDPQPGVFGAHEPMDGMPLWRDLRRLWRAWRGEADRVAHLHTDHLGAPELVTGADGRTLWRAGYDAFGRAEVVAVEPGFGLDLRRPGQHEDPDTGLHHNDHRTLDPVAGRYLSPDPLGAPDGPNPYAHVRNAPLRHVDPTGLILFAFDGTGNTPADRTNVWHFAQAYDDLSAFDRARGYTGMSFYVQGPGTRHGNGLDGLEQAAPTTLRGTVDGQMARFEGYLRDAVAWHRDRPGRLPGGRVRVDLDVVGFSRGAALARDFSNEVADYRRSGRLATDYGGCVDVLQRLLALFDTVLSSHRLLRGDAPIRLAVPPEVAHAFHAVALHEKRDRFPLESILADPAAAEAGGTAHRVERGFIGAHADIGGGYNGLETTHPTGGDLSDLALQWMVQQARRAGVRLHELPAELRRVTSPIVHDPRREALWRWTGAMRHGSREVRFHPPSGASGTPGAGHRQPQSAVRWAHVAGQAETERFVVGGFDTGRHDPRVGVVQLCSYLAWLRAHHGMAIDPHPGCS